MTDIDLTRIELFLDELRLVFGRAANTIDAYYFDLRRLAEGLGSKNKTLLNASEDDLLVVFTDLQAELSPASRIRAISSARSFYGFLVDARLLGASPMAGIEVPKKPALLPGVLSIAEVGALMSVIDTISPIGLRNRSILELIYGSGLRVSEAVGADLDDLFLDDSLLRVIGKGAKTRVVPITSIASKFLRLYILGGGRTALETKKRSSAIFYSSRGTRLTRQAIWQMTKKYSVLAGITSEVHPHTLRHSCATHMVNNGADLRVVQELLGHTSLSTTQIYTHVSPQRLQSVYRMAHPRASFDPEVIQPRTAH